MKTVLVISEYDREFKERDVIGVATSVEQADKMVEEYFLLTEKGFDVEVFPTTRGEIGLPVKQFSVIGGTGFDETDSIITYMEYIIGEV